MRRKNKAVPPCPACGGPREARDADRLCEACRSPAGKMAELARAVALVENATMPAESLHGVACWPEVSHLACERFGHPTFTTATLERLEAFVQTELGTDRNGMLGTPITEVVNLLRRSKQAAPKEERAIAQDGPDRVREFHWRGRTVEMEPQPWHLVKFLWGCKDHAAGTHAVAEGAWGNPDVSDTAIAAAASRANTAFAERGIPLSVSVNAGTVALDGAD